MSESKDRITEPSDAGKSKHNVEKLFEEMWRAIDLATAEVKRTREKFNRLYSEAVSKGSRVDLEMVRELNVSISRLERLFPEMKQ